VDYDVYNYLDCREEPSMNDVAYWGEMMWSLMKLLK
jgi:hypothetical protein